MLVNLGRPVERVIIMLILGAAFSVTASVIAQTPTRPAGTLACITEPSSKTENAITNLSCDFDAIDGPDAHFAAQLVRRSHAEILRGKEVFLWTVLVGSADFDMGRLEGRSIGCPVVGRQPYQRMQEESFCNRLLIRRKSAIIRAFPFLVSNSNRGACDAGREIDLGRLTDS